MIVRRVAIDEFFKFRPSGLWFFDDLNNLAVDEVVIHVIAVNEDGGETGAGFGKKDNTFIVGVFKIAFNVGHAINDRQNIVAIFYNRTGRVYKNIVAIFNRKTVNVGLIHGMAGGLDGEDAFFLAQ